MKVAKQCYGCLQRLVYQASSLASEDIHIRQSAIDRGLQVLGENYSDDEVSIVIATKIHDIIKEVTQNPDPYREMKAREITLARELCSEIRGECVNDFYGCLKIAASGNTIDFFRSLNTIKEDMRKPIKFAIDDSEQLRMKLRQGGRVMYLADNAGEVFLDLPLIKWMRGFAEVTYVVKESPVQDDATPEDIRQAGMESQVGRIITTGTATPGIDFSLASSQFKQEFEAAALIFAKGMGYYESLSELPAKGRVFYCLRAKCEPVARSIGVSVNSYVAMLH